MSLSALAEVNEEYRNTYGGWKREGGIDMGNPDRKSPPLNLSKINTHLPYPEFQRVRLIYSPTPDEGYDSRSQTTSISSESCLSFYAFSPSYSPEPPPNHTTQQRSSSPMDIPLPEIKPLLSPVTLSTPNNLHSHAGRDLTKSLIKPLPTPTPKLPPASIATRQPLPTPPPKVLSPKLDTSFLSMLNARPDKGPHFRGPLTPNGYEDITPVTKGEWCFLMVGEGWGQGRRDPVVTCN